MEIKFRYENKEFKISSSATGMDVVSVNGTVVSQKRNLINIKPEYSFLYEGDQYVLAMNSSLVQQITNVKLSRNGLIVHDQDFDQKGRSFEAAKVPIAKWSYIFIVLCAIIPFITRGGAIPAAIGLGGAGLCMIVSRKSSLGTGLKIAACSGITLVSWALMIILILVLSGIRR